MRKGQRSWGRILAPNSGNKANMAEHKNFNLFNLFKTRLIFPRINGPNVCVTD